MLQKVQITDSHDSKFLLGEKVSKRIFNEENERLENEKLKKAEAKPILLGVMQAALHTDSFISAASFQETTRILTAEAIKGSIDYFRGPKENVILGRLAPVGTGFKHGSKAYDYTLVKNEEEKVVETKEKILSEQKVFAED